MIIRKLFYLFFVYLFTSNLASQNYYQKKLELLQNKITDKQYSQLDSMKFYIDKLKNTIKSNDSIWLSKYYSILGVYYQQTSKYDEAKEQQLRSLEIATNINNGLLKAKANQRLGVIYKFLGDFEVSMDYFFKSRDLSYENKDTLTAATAEMTIAQIYWYLKQYDKGFTQIDKTIRIGKKRNLLDEIVAPSYIEKGNMYLLLGKLDSALVYYKNAEKTVKLTKQQEGLVSIYSNIGGVYFYKNNMSLAIENYKKAIDLAHKFGDKISYGISKMNLGEALYTLNNYSAAEKVLEESLKLFKELKSKQNLVYTYNYLYELENKRKDFKKALEYFRLKNSYRDSIINERNLNKISDLEVKYKTVEKEKQISNQNLELQTQKATIANQRITQLLLIGSLGFIILVGLFFYSRNKAKQEKALQEAVLLEKEKGFAAVIKASEDERKRISKDLHDGIGQEMAALKIAINHVKEQEQDKNQKTALEKIYNNCSKSADEIRNISHQMMPRTLLENGLIEAIDDLLTATFEYSNTDYTFEHFNINNRFNERIEISLYRVAQELINNVIKHANATEVNVMLYQQEQSLIFFLEDNGIGMNNNNNKGHGVLNIKSRIDMIKGTINYEPSSNSGTTATIKIPLN